MVPDWRLLGLGSYLYLGVLNFTSCRDHVYKAS